MYLEKRTVGKSTKYYLAYSFRDKDNKVVKIRRFLGTNLNKKDLDRLSKRAEEIINQQIEEMNVKLFNFSLTEKQISLLNKYDEKINIVHFDDKEWQQFTEEFVYNTNAIEGSSVLLDEVPQILDKKTTNNSEEIETKGVANAINFMRTTKQDLTLSLILKLHKICFEGSKSFAGKLRNVKVVIRGQNGEIIHSGSPANKVKYELEKLVRWYNKNKKKFKPLVLAAIIHNQFEDIHPFQDGNGRVGRLLLNFVLLKHHYPPINILLKDRAEYYFILQEYQKKDKLLSTLQFLVKQYKKNIRKVTTKSKKK